MANKEIHELITAETLSASDVIAEQREDSGTWLVLEQGAGLRFRFTYDR